MLVQQRQSRTAVNAIKTQKTTFLVVFFFDISLYFDYIRLSSSFNSFNSSSPSGVIVPELRSRAVLTFGAASTLRRATANKVVTSSALINYFFQKNIEFSDNFKKKKKKKKKKKRD
jgi:hypothetical protein